MISESEIIAILDKLQISTNGDIIKNVSDFIEKYERMKEELEEAKLALNLIAPL